MLNINEEILNIRRDANLLDAFLQDYETFVLASASEVSKRFISKSDDEWSIALIAFYNAIKSFDADKGSFFPYAKLMIRSRLIDYFRSQGRHANQISLEFVEESEMITESRELGVNEEIESLTQTLKQYGFGFAELARSSPKAEKTRDACKKAVRYLIKTPVLLADMQKTKMLPIKIIEKNTQVPRKILERHRRYIMTAAEIITGDYPNLREYFGYVWKTDYMKSSTK